MQKMKVGEVSTLLGVSQTCIYRKAKALGGKLDGLAFKEKGVLFFSPEAVELIRQTISTAPAETVLQTVPVCQVPDAPAPIAPEIAGRLEAMERAIMLLVDENRSLRGEVSSLRLRLEPPAPVEPPVPPAPRRQVEKPPAQREPSLWESVAMTFNDMLGFAFGRG
jgi:hypothetical protein